MQLSPENQRWLDNFKARYGRSPRILHIGNIANNAYNNAKILNSVGIDSDVICYDYYHIMGCPEWEDADFDATNLDHFKPNWSAIDLGGFKRPRWFAQGSQELCIEYLIAKKTGDSQRANTLWQELGYENKTARYRDANALSSRLACFGNQQKVRVKRVLLHEDAQAVAWTKLGTLGSRYGALGYILVAVVAPIIFLGMAIARLLIHVMQALWRVQKNMVHDFYYNNEVGKKFSDIHAFGYWGHQQKTRVRRLLLREDPLSAVWTKLGSLANSYEVFGFILAGAVALPVLLGAAIAGSLSRVIQPWWPVDKNTVNDFNYKNEVAKRVLQFSESFTDRTDKLSAKDLATYAFVIDSWRQLFTYYDIIQAYSTDGIFPLLADVPYIAFEHGTIRDIPYNATPQGRLTALTYRCANHVFVTNFDCRQSAEFLAPAQYTLINHPYDEDHGMTVDGLEELRLELKAELESDFLFFFPTRQDWVPGTGYADKANDIFLKAFCKLRTEGYSVGLVCCSWGTNVSESQELLKELGCERHVRWVEPMAIVPFERMAKACGCVVDQFKLGAFGGVLFKAMSVGIPVLTYLDEQRLKEQYEEVPPVINCRTELEIADSMRKLIDNPEILISKGQESRAWIKKFHGKNETVNAQVNQYRHLMPA